MRSRVQPPSSIPRGYRNTYIYKNNSSRAGWKKTRFGNRKVVYERKGERKGSRFIASLRKKINYGTGSNDNSSCRIVKDDFPLEGGRENRGEGGLRLSGRL